MNETLQTASSDIAEPWPAPKLRRRRARFLVGLFVLCCGVFVAGYQFGEFDSLPGGHDDLGLLLFRLAVTAAPLICFGVILIRKKVRLQ
jgi:hypothetical protein